MRRLWPLACVVAALASLAARQPASSADAPTAATCGGCHLVPPAGVLPRAAWRDSTVRMQRIRDGSEATATPTIVLPEDFAGALAWS
jgi:hypothetical protein